MFGVDDFDIDEVSSWQDFRLSYDRVASDGVADAIRGELVQIARQSPPDCRRYSFREGVCGYLGELSPFWSCATGLSPSGHKIRIHRSPHEDKFNPLVALTFDELRTTYGDELGEVIDHQFGLLWQVVARGNPNPLSSMTLGSAAESLFSEIKTGGHGEPIRKSNVEHKNIISFVL